MQILVVKFDNNRAISFSFSVTLDHFVVQAHLAIATS